MVAIANDDGSSSRVELAYIGLIIVRPTEDVATLAELHFGDERCRIAIQAIRRLKERGGSVDAVTVAEEILSIVPEFDGVAEWLLAAMDSWGELTSASEYAARIQEFYQRRKAAEIGRKAIRMAHDRTRDIAETIMATEEAFNNLGNDTITSPAKLIGDTLISLQDRIDKGGPTYVPTGLTALDQILGGFRPGQIITLGARPSVGKTALMLCILGEIARGQTPVGICSLEMTTEELQERLLSTHAVLDGESIRHPSDAERLTIVDELNSLSQLPIVIDDESRTLRGIVATIRDMRRRHKVEVVGIDYLGLIESGDPRMIREQQVATITRKLKELAKVLKITIVLLCQLNRDVERRDDKKPRLSDLRESGAIEQDSDVVLLLHRPAMYDPNAPRDVGFVTVAKQRSGPIGSVAIAWNARRSEYSNILPGGGAF